MKKLFALILSLILVLSLSVGALADAKARNLDEITAALDPEMVREVLNVVLDLARDGRTMLIVTHEMRFAEAVADRVLFLERGKVVEEGRPADFFHHPQTPRARAFLDTFEFDTVKKA